MTRFRDPERKSSSGFWLISLGLFLFSLAIFGWQASQTTLLNRDFSDRDRFDVRQPMKDAGNLDAQRIAAEDYWRRYPNVSRDSYYGRDGQLGVVGARQHYEDHGRREGRQWNE